MYVQDISFLLIVVRIFIRLNESVI